MTPDHAPMPRLTFNGRRIPLPRSPAVRVGVGALLIVGGLVGFLPVVGFWMVPVGLMVLSVDLPPVRRFRRRSEVSLLRRWRAWRGRDAADADRATEKRGDGP